MRGASPLDLVVLVPGKDDKAVVDGLLSRTKSLQIRAISHETVVHPQRDPGCFQHGATFLQIYQTRATHALVLFDYVGSGQDNKRRNVTEVEGDLRGRLQRSGWDDRAEVLVIEPELEIWVWSDSPVVDEALGWQGYNPSLRDWLTANGLLTPGSVKPDRPKEAVEAALAHVQLSRSSSIYRRIAENVTLHRCQDPAFTRLRELLSKWFSA